MSWCDVDKPIRYFVKHIYTNTRHREPAPGDGRGCRFGVREPVQWGEGGGESGLTECARAGRGENIPEHQSKAPTGNVD